MAFHRPVRVPVCALIVIAGAAALHAQPGADAMRKADAAFHAGYAAAQAGRYEEARAQFAEVVRLAPQIAEGHEALGSALLALGRPAEAIPEMEKAARLKPHDPGIETNLGVAFYQAGRAADSIPHFEAAMKPGAPQPGPSVVDNYARALAAVGRRDDALKQFAAEEQIAGPRAEVDDAIGTVYAQMERWDEAKGAFERALSEDSTYIPARIHLGAVYRQQHDLNAAVAALEPAAKADPPNALALA